MITGKTDLCPPLGYSTANCKAPLIYMAHKVTTMGLVDETTPTAAVAGSCNAVLKRPDGMLLGDMSSAWAQRGDELRSVARLDS